MKLLNKITLFFFLPLVLSLFSCAKEKMISVTADFKITVVNNDYSVPVRVEVENISTGADTYQWSFEGASITSSTNKIPAPAYYNAPGKYTIILKASNKDGAKDEKRIDIQIDAAMATDFDWQIQGSDISPVTLQMVNKSLGASTYLWTFENGSPETSAAPNPKVVFTSPGNHLIKLIIDNGKETYSSEKTVTVKPAMTVDFDWTVDFTDLDYQAPVRLHLNNKSTNAVAYEWTFVNEQGVLSIAQNPDIDINTPGTYVLQLKSTNDKESKVSQKQIVIQPNKNLLAFNDVKLGINTAQLSIGCFFSSTLGKVLTKNEVNAENGAKIDFAFFGLDAAFNYNQFVSPDQVQNTAFNAIPGAIHTKITNSQELVGVQLTAVQFDAIDSGTDFSNMTVTESTKGLTPFNQTTSNRVILFQTADGRKGGLIVTGYTTAGQNSYILANIKIQKTP